jgi:hypothetical protein
MSAVFNISIPFFGVATGYYLAELRANFRAIIEANNLGESVVGNFFNVWQKGMVVAIMSYNGRAWLPSPNGIMGEELSELPGATLPTVDYVAVANAVKAAQTYVAAMQLPARATVEKRSTDAALLDRSPCCHVLELQSLAYTRLQEAVDPNRNMVTANALKTFVQVHS